MADSSPSVAASSFIDPAALMQIQSLELRARSVVEGFFSGLHRSPYHGFSVEFSEYRQYVDGDDLRYLDWRLYARSDRYYVKRFEDETNLRCHLIVDNSRSMSYGSLAYNKAEYAKTLAATLACFLTRQRDAVGLIRFSEEIDEELPARFRAGQLRRLLLALDHDPSGHGTGLTAALERLAQRIRKRGMFLLLSDFLTPVEDLGRQLGYLRAGGHEIAVFQILDPAELSFPFAEPKLFVDAETGRKIHIDPESARSNYQQRLQDHLAGIERCCGEHGITVSRLTTDTPLERALFDFLRVRLQSLRSRTRPGRF